MENKSKARDNSVKSVIKAFSIIETLDENGELSIAELSAKLSMDKATIHRLVNTIKDIGYIVQNEDTKKYSNSINLFAIGQRVVERISLREIARPYLEKLAKESKETINIAVYSRGEITYIDKIESDSALKIGINVGTSVPAYCTGMGKAVLAFMNEAFLEKELSFMSFVKLTKNTCDTPAMLLDNLAEIRRKGYSKDNEEYVEGLISFGAPIFDHMGVPIAAISISCPKQRFDRMIHEKMYSQMVMATTGMISETLGYQRAGALQKNNNLQGTI